MKLSKTMIDLDRSHYGKNTTNLVLICSECMLVLSKLDIFPVSIQEVQDKAADLDHKCSDVQYAFV